MTLRPSFSFTSMGINGLWNELAPIEQKLSQLDLLETLLGLADFAGWMWRASMLHGNNESPGGVALFSRCSRIHRFPLLPHFVFDGRERAGLKNGIVISGNDHPLTEMFKSMLDGFGFDWTVAPGEAEATLAEMTTNGVPVRVDTILTDDSDSFVFGASAVLRIRSEDNERYEASLYSATDIAAVLGLTRDDFIMIAILAGGDYSPGLRNCGITTAMALAKTGLGKQLVTGLYGLTRRDSMLFLDTWRKSLRSELLTNASGHLPHLFPSLAANIPAGFPDLNVINQYRQPIIALQTAARPLELHPPRLDLLARFAEDHFQWGNSVGILDHLADQLFPGLVIRELSARALAVDGLALFPSAPSIIKCVVGAREHKSTGHLSELHLVLSLDPIILRSALQAITGRRDPAHGAQDAVTEWITTKLPKVRVWVPKSMMEHVDSTLVLDYICKQPEARKLQSRNSKATKSAVASSSSAITAGEPGVFIVSILGADRNPHVADSMQHTPYHEKRYTTMTITHKGREVVELITDSEGEL
ncbi:PIN domain-like protein [Mycena crocata]|nr:PIN domain-like protein [Mycena crocata]